MTSVRAFALKILVTGTTTWVLATGVSSPVHAVAPGSISITGCSFTGGSVTSSDYFLAIDPDNNDFGPDITMSATPVPSTGLRVTQDVGYVNRSTGAFVLASGPGTGTPYTNYAPPTSLGSWAYSWANWSDPNATYPISEWNIAFRYFAVGGSDPNNPIVDTADTPICIITTGLGSSPQPEPDPSPDAPVAPTPVSLSLDANGGSCTATAITGSAGTWAPLPEASACTKDGSTLSGWTTQDGKLSFAPGAQVNLTGGNTLVAQWSARTAAQPGASTGPASQPAAAAKKLTVLKWRVSKSGDLKLISGDLTELGNRNALFTVVAKQQGTVTPNDIAKAKSLAAQYGGTYGGFIQGDQWAKPRIVAAYLT